MAPVQVGKKTGNLEGTTFAGRYAIVRRIGEGGMGMVYEARDTQANGERIVAIKVLHRDVCNDDKAVRRFFSEARVLNSLSHPNIIELFDFGRSDDKRLYIAMELLEGRPADVLIKHKQLTPLNALQILDQTAAGLGEAHLQGVIHRDLKPANIFARKQPDGSLFVTVLDFGIAKITGGQNLTVTGKVMGTPSYMAPEQIMGNQPDPRTDIYALGAMGYELICGRPPFVADTPLTLLYSHLNDTPPSLLDLAPRNSISKPLADVLFTFLAKDPNHRPRNTVEVRRLLAPFLEDPSRITSGQVDLTGIGGVELLDSDQGSTRGQQILDNKPSGKPTQEGGGQA
ncbi:MAG: serine/threonine-protein kinase [Myxococcota bacterium]